MGASEEENSTLFPIFTLTIMAIPLVPYTMVKLTLVEHEPAFISNGHCSSLRWHIIALYSRCLYAPCDCCYISLESRSSKELYVMHQTLSASLAPSKVMDVFTKAACELSLDPKNMKQEQAKFWKQHPAIVKTELLIQAQLTRESAALSPALEDDFRRVLELAPRLLEELLKMAVLPRTAQGHGWLRPAVGVIELSQCIVQDILGQYSMVNLELFNIVEEVKKVSKAFVVLPKNVNAENAQSAGEMVYRDY
ncbi:BnaA06g00080D [Brassica napus]|uniref:BnaA06g00080D protein n=2 Tax=Brassica TaxID=3705 RepID=A0A078IPE2_BRANA|nr:BnaA06g00080D [Brassica napus]